MRNATACRMGSWSGAFADDDARSQQYSGSHLVSKRQAQAITVVVPVILSVDAPKVLNFLLVSAKKLTLGAKLVLMALSLKVPRLHKIIDANCCVYKNCIPAIRLF